MSNISPEFKQDLSNANILISQSSANFQSGFKITNEEVFNEAVEMISNSLKNSEAVSFDNYKEHLMYVRDYFTQETSRVSEKAGNTRILNQTFAIALGKAHLTDGFEKHKTDFIAIMASSKEESFKVGPRSYSV